jgi:hypothetical protein
VNQLGQYRTPPFALSHEPGEASPPSPISRGTLSAFAPKLGGHLNRLV